MKKITLITCCLAITTGAWAADSQTGDATNTGQNSQDRSSNTLTSGDQSESQPDIQITAAIRRELVGDKSLSTDAQNIKIITVGGETTLRGPVRSSEEKQKIAEYAKEGGAQKVINKLKVEQPQ